MEEISRQGSIQAAARLLLTVRIQVHGEREQEVEQKEMKRVCVMRKSIGVSTALQTRQIQQQR